jgi:hypothetical protein
VLVGNSGIQNSVNVVTTPCAAGAR